MKHKFLCLYRVIYKIIKNLKLLMYFIPETKNYKRAHYLLLGPIE